MKTVGGGETKKMKRNIQLQSYYEKASSYDFGKRIQVKEGFPVFRIYLFFVSYLSAISQSF